MGKSQKSLNDEKSFNHSIFTALATTIDTKDYFSKGHSLRVANYALEIAKRMGKSPDERKQIYYAALLHDIGKIRVPESILNKPEKLLHTEFEQIKIHPSIGFHILREANQNSLLALGVKYHHERFDGLGYPNGLKGESIPEVARIIAVADAYDAMTSARSYRNALDQNEVKEELKKGSGTQFDPKIAAIMLQMVEEDKFYTMREVPNKNKIILVIDDEKINATLIEEILKDERDYKIVDMNSGKKALQFLKNCPVDLVLLDVYMPEMDGFETFEEIKKISNVPVIFTTAARDIEVRQKLYELGINDYLTKPYMPLVFKEVVRSVLSTGKSFEKNSPPLNFS